MISARIRDAVAAMQAEDPPRRAVAVHLGNREANRLHLEDRGEYDDEGNRYTQGLPVVWLKVRSYFRVVGVPA